MSMSYEFDAPQFIDFANLENEEDESEAFFKNYVCPSSFKVKKKRLKLDNEDSYKAQVSTPVNRCNRSSFVGSRKYKSTPHPKGRGLKRLSRSQGLPRFVELDSKSVRKFRSKAPTEAVVKVCKTGLTIDKALKDSTTVNAHLLKVKKLNSKKRNDEANDDMKSSKRPSSQSRLASKLPQVIKSRNALQSTIPKPFTFATELRSSSRRQFEERMSKKLIADEDKKNRMKELNTVKEKQDLVNFRKTLVHKPIPMKVGKPFEKKPYLKKPTIPISPKLGLSRKGP